MLASLGEQLGLEDELEDYWAEHDDLGPLQRFMSAVGQAALPKVSGKLVIFVDEIDAVRSLPFAADEFFAAIRECYNRRTREPEYERFTFCLSGVATPADLISDTRMSPFNIGRRILLTDFTMREAAPLAQGLAGGKPIVDRVLHWTNGHPYMTQRLCRAIADEPVDISPRQVDAICKRLFLTKQAQETDDNLAFVRNRLLRSEADLSALLSLFERVRSGRKVKDDETNPLCSVLRLSGVVTEKDGLLRLRNRIYDAVFDRDWVASHMPDAERRRQREAYRRGILRAAMGGAAIVILLAIFALEALHEKIVADTNFQTSSGLLRLADLQLAGQIWDSPNGSAQAVARLLDASRAGELGPNQRFEWRYQWNLLYNSSAATLTNPATSQYTVEAAVTKDRVLTALYAGKILETTPIGPLARPASQDLPSAIPFLASAALAPDGAHIAVGLTNGAVELRDAATLRRLRSWDRPGGPITAVSFLSAHQVAVSRKDGSAQCWDAASGKMLASMPLGTVPPQAELERSTTFSAGPHYYRAELNRPQYGQVRVIDLGKLGTPGYSAGMMGMPGPDITAAHFSPDGTRLAVGDAMGRIAVYETATGRLDRSWIGHATFVTAISFSGDGRLLASGEWDGLVRVWDAEQYSGIPAAPPKLLGKPLMWDAEQDSGHPLLSLKSHTAPIRAVTFSPDGKLLASADTTGVVHAWYLASAPSSVLTTRPGDIVTGVTISPDGATLAGTTMGGQAFLWDTRTWQRTRLPAADSPARSGVEAIAFSSDNRQVATAGLIRAARAEQWETFLQITDLHTRTGRVVYRAPAPATSTPLGDSLTCLSFSPDASLIAGGWGSEFNLGDRTSESVGIWDAVTGTEVATLTGFYGSIGALAWAPDGHILAVVCYDGTVRQFDTRTWQPISRLTEQTSATAGFLSGCYSPDGSVLALGDFQGQIQLWDTHDWRLLHRLTGHALGVLSLAFSPDGQTLASGSMDQTIKLWDVASGQSTRTLTGASNWVIRVAFSPDGSVLAAGDADGNIRLWRAAEPAEIAAWDQSRAQSAQESESPLGWVSAQDDQVAAASLLTDVTSHRVPGYDSGAQAHSLLVPTAGSAGWRFFIEPTSKAAGSGTITRDETLTANVTRSVPANWQVQYYQTRLPLVAGQRYVVQFRAKSVTPRDLVVAAQRDIAPYDGIGLVETVNLSTDWQAFRFRFQVTRVPANHGELMFGFGDQTGTVQIADVVLVPDKDQ
jgi:WD40 repeat protein